MTVPRSAAASEASHRNSPFVLKPETRDSHSIRRTFQSSNVETILRCQNLMRATFILGTVLLALVLGIGAMASGSTGLVAAVAVGVVPVLLGISTLIESVTGRDMWHLSTPYPYRSMRDAGLTAMPAARRPGQRADDHHRAEDHADDDPSGISLAA